MVAKRYLTFLLTIVCYCHTVCSNKLLGTNAVCPRRTNYAPKSVEEARFYLTVYPELVGQAALDTVESSPRSRMRDFDPVEATVLQVQNALFRRNSTCREILTAHIARIEAYNPVINAIIALSPTALVEADLIDQTIAAGRFTSSTHSLLCVPTLLKDNFDVEGMPTTAGSIAFADLWPSTDARTVRRLKAAGALILGKTNMQELALEGISVSSLGGQTRNPYDLARTPGGSSGGSGAALATSFAVLATGSDTMNSLRSPASANSLFSLRPTRGLLSRAGVMPVSSTQDTVGPMARTVADLAAMYAAMLAPEPDAHEERDPVGNTCSDMSDCYKEENDATTKLVPTNDPARSFTFSAPSDPLENHLAGLRFGVLEPLFDWDASSEDRQEADVVNNVVGEFLSVLQQAGATLVPVRSPILDPQKLAKLDVQKFETGDELNEYLASSRRKGSFPRNVAELFAATDDEVMGARRFCEEGCCSLPEGGCVAGGNSHTKNDSHTVGVSGASSHEFSNINHGMESSKFDIGTAARDNAAPYRRSPGNFCILPHQYAHISALLSSSPRNSTYCSALYSSRLRSILQLQKDLAAIFTSPSQSPNSLYPVGSNRTCRPATAHADSPSPANSTNESSNNTCSSEFVLDFLLYPEQRRLVVPIGSPSQAGRNGHLAALTGFPVLTLPAGFSGPLRGRDSNSAFNRSGVNRSAYGRKQAEGDQPAVRSTQPKDYGELGIPIGVEMLGCPGSEQALFQAAAVIERITRARRPPPPLPCSLVPDGVQEADEKVGADDCGEMEAARSRYETVPVITPDTANIPTEYPIGVR